MIGTKHYFRKWVFFFGGGGGKGRNCWICFICLFATTFTKCLRFCALVPFLQGFKRLDV